MSQLTATNCRTGTSSSRPELSRLLQHFQGMKIYQDLTSFPNACDDLTPLPQLFWQHAYEPNFYMPKECFQVRNEQCPNGPVSGISRADQGGGELQPSVKLTTHSFRPDAVTDVWSIKIEQIWADFYGMASSKDRPVPLLDPFTMNVWMCSPNKSQPATSVSQSQSRTDVKATLSNQSLNRFNQPFELPNNLLANHKPVNSHGGHRPNSAPNLPGNMVLRSNGDYSPSQDSLSSSDGGRSSGSFEDLTPVASSRVMKSRSQEFRSDPESDTEQTR